VPDYTDGHVLKVKGGMEHAVLLLDDKIVCAFGYKDFTQYEIKEEWQGHVIDVNAGDYFTLIKLSYPDNNNKNENENENEQQTEIEKVDGQETTETPLIPKSESIVLDGNGMDGSGQISVVVDTPGVTRYWCGGKYSFVLDSNNILDTNHE